MQEVSADERKAIANRLRVVAENLEQGSVTPDEYVSLIFTYWTKQVDK
jgi:hypothetical protein